MKSDNKQPQIKITRKTIEVSCFREWLNDTVNIEMMQIPSGTFMMGSPPEELGRTNHEEPQHQVTVSGFWMSKYPITQAQWRVVAKFPQVERQLETDPSHFKGDNRPVENVNWYDAMEFCQRLTRYIKHPYCLPSEAEWEYACRAGTTTPFHFGQTITGKLANYRTTATYPQELEHLARKSVRQTTPINQFKAANNFGLWDMHGNVWEWCCDPWHDNYENAPRNGSVWLQGGSNRLHVIRGGSWYSSPEDCRSAFRTFHTPSNRDDSGLSFRVVCVLPSQM